MIYIPSTLHLQLIALMHRLAGLDAAIAYERLKSCQTCWLTREVLILVQSVLAPLEQPEPLAMLAQLQTYCQDDPIEQQRQSLARLLSQ